MLACETFAVLNDLKTF